MYNLGRLKCITDLIPYTTSPDYALDLGCSTGRTAKIVREKGYEYVGLEISKEKLQKANEIRSKDDISLLQGSADSLPFKCCFKLVIATEIIEHLENPYKLLVEINNILAQGGYLVISTPNRVSLEGLLGKTLNLYNFLLLRKKRWNAWDIEHKHIFSSFEFVSLLKTKFSIIDVFGYYFLPRVPFTQEFDEKWLLGTHLRYLRTHHKPFNRFGFQTIVLLKKEEAEI